MFYKPPTHTEILEHFEFFDSWEDKYRYIIELGKELPQLDSQSRIEENLIRGCQSQVWITHHFDKDQKTLKFKIDSDAHIVRGLICTILSIYQNQTPTQIVKRDIESFFSNLGLLNHLSPTRGNGLRAMVGHIRTIAQEIVSNP